MATYLTRAGYQKIADELQGLVGSERPKVVQEVQDAAAQGDRSENAEYIYGKKRLREIDRRIRFLTKRLDTAVVVTDESRNKDVVFFGATVDVEDENGKKSRYTIVGPDEANPEKRLLSFKSPLGRALMKKKVGDVVVVDRPAGEIEIEILAIGYD